MLASIIIPGLVLGGTYAFLAMGLTLQYGISRILNLAYGELVIFAAFASFLLFSNLNINPIVGMVFVLPLAFGAGYLIYGLFLQPLVRRADKKGTVEVDTILGTFGLLFLLQGIMLVLFGSNYTSYNFLNFGVDVFGATIAANRLVAFGLAMIIGIVLYFVLAKTRWGIQVRAIAVSPASAPLVGIDVERTARLAFALGSMLAAAGGVMISMYQTFNVSMAVLLTMKALVIVIMGGVGNLMGALVAGLILGLVETAVATYVDPGLTLAATYIIFLGVLLWKPTGLFGRSGG